MTEMKPLEASRRSSASASQFQFPVSCFIAAALLSAGLTGCGTQALLDGLPPHYVSEDNYLTFDHAFTDATAEAVRKRAETYCAIRKQAAVKTSSACSLTRCTTNYQCMDPAAAAAFRPSEGKR